MKIEKTGDGAKSERVLSCGCGVSGKCRNDWLWRAQQRRGAIFSYSAVSQSVSESNEMSKLSSPSLTSSNEERQGDSDCQSLLRRIIRDFAYGTNY